MMVANSTLHCGSGCTLGDIAAEWLMVAFPAIAVAFGYKSIFPHEIFARWIVDYIFAYAFGIVFQYFTIAPMRGLSLMKGIVAAIKADTLSLTAWQIGMYGFMAIAHFVIFRIAFGSKLKPTTPEFWFMMQVGYGLWVSDVIPRELVAYQKRPQRENVARLSGCDARRILAGAGPRSFW